MPAKAFYSLVPEKSGYKVIKCVVAESGITSIETIHPEDYLQIALSMLNQAIRKDMGL